MYQRYVHFNERDIFIHHHVKKTKPKMLFNLQIYLYMQGCESICEKKSEMKCLKTCFSMHYKFENVYVTSYPAWNFH